MSEVRYPFDRLESLIVVELDAELNSVGQPASRTRRVAEQLGVHHRQIYRWRQTGVTADQADALAVRAHMHPLEVWPELDDLAKVDCQARGCDQRFVPYRRNQKWCSPRCSKRERVRRRYHRDAAFAAAENARCRAYYAACAEAERKKARARYWQKVAA